MRGQSVTKNEEKDAKLLNVKADHETRNGIFLVVPRLLPPPPPMLIICSIDTAKRIFKASIHLLLSLL